MGSWQGTDGKGSIRNLHKKAFLGNKTQSSGQGKREKESPPECPSRGRWIMVSDEI